MLCPQPFIYTYVQLPFVQTKVLYHSPNRQLNQQPATESPTGKWIGNRPPALNFTDVDLSFLFTLFILIFYYGIYNWHFHNYKQENNMIPNQYYASSYDF